jgi:hypothetical protein
MCAHNTLWEASASAKPQPVRVDGSIAEEKSKGDSVDDLTSGFELH